MKFLLVLLLFNFGILCYGFSQPRIWNGKIAPPNKYPNVPRLFHLQMIIVDVKNETTNETIAYGYPGIQSMLCTGSIISDRHILTAAHCIGRPIEHTATEFAIDLRPATVIDYGELDTNFGKGKTKLLLKSHGFSTIYHIHAGWKNLSYIGDYDVAIIEFPIGTKLGIKPVILAKNFVESDGDVGIAVGYGDTDPSKENFATPSNLMELQVPILTKDCEIWKQKNYKILCAGTKTERVDHGDSGGPLFYSKNDLLYQIGVVSSGAKKMVIQLMLMQLFFLEFALFNRVSVYCDWIANITNGEAKCQDIPGMPIPTPPIPAPQSGGMSYKIILPILSMLLTFFIAL